jgi:hypothetical protein
MSKMHEAFTYAAEAAADLSEKLHYFAKIDANGKIDLAADGGPIAGVIHESSVLAGTTSIYFGAIGKVICAEAITPGAQLASDTNGKAVAAAVGDWVAGIAINTAASAAGDLVPFIFASNRRHA